MYEKSKTAGLMHLALYTILCFSSLTLAHFVLQFPPSLGFDDVKEGQGPCGSFSIPSGDDTSVKSTDWPIYGAAVDVLSTHPNALWTYRAALLNATDTWVTLQSNVTQQGVGDFCLPAVPGKKEWTGLSAVVQVTQNAVDGTLYQVFLLIFLARFQR